MLRLLKWLLIALLAALLAAVVGVVWYSRAVQPQLEGELRLAGLPGPVEVRRDAEGVPHIRAQREAEAQYALGFVHAQDRLWQMEVNRRVAAGRLAEILGAPALDADRFLRTLGVRRAAEAQWKNLDAPTRALYMAYAAGVNAYLAQRSGPLPPEFVLTRAPAPEPWSPVDSLGWMIMMAWDLGGNWGNELMRLRLAQHGLAQARIAEVLPPYRDDPAPVVADYSTLYLQLAPQAAALSLAWNAAPGYVEGTGSNNWVVGGAKSATGKPLLANDPHLGLSAPALWYFAHLETADGLAVIGATLPGVPGVILGRNRSIAWGFTNTAPDVQDLYIEQLDPNDATRYRTPEGWAAFQVIEERIAVKGAAEVKLKVRVSRHGPIVSDGGHAAITRAAPKGHAIAFAWTALAPDNLTAAAAPRLNRASNWAEFLAALRFFHAPQQNVVYADVGGNIGFIAPARIPVRKPENDLRGLYPAPGWDARYDWAGWIPFDELPRRYNPAEAQVVTANQKIVEPGYPHHLTYEWAVPYRADRIGALLAAQPRHTLEGFALMQADTASLALREVLPLLLRAPAAGEAERKAVALLRGWDGAMLAERAEPLIATAWMREIARGVYADEFGPALFKAYFDQRHVFLRNVLADANGQGRWCDDVVTPARESCDAVVAAALTRALNDLAARYGSDPAAWRWGEAHAARSTHRPFSRVAQLAKWFDVRVPTPGDTYTVNVGRHTIRDEDEPFVNRHAASLRALYDLADLENSRWMHSTGQSGIVFSPWYRSYAERWAAVRYMPMRMDARAEAGTLKLVPR